MMTRYIALLPVLVLLEDVTTKAAAASNATEAPVIIEGDESAWDTIVADLDSLIALISTIHKTVDEVAQEGLDKFAEIRNYTIDEARKSVADTLLDLTTYSRPPYAYECQAQIICAEPSTAAPEANLAPAATTPAQP